MPEPTKFSTGSGSPDPLFKEPPREKSFPTAAVAIAAVVVVIAAVALLVIGRRDGKATANATYAANLQMTNLQMSQSESLSGGKSTYLDGHIANRGNQTVTGVTVQAEFGVDGGQPQTLTAPVAIIRTREPYIDTEPLTAAPLPPGGEADFRLIFEGVGDSWDQKTPALQIVQVSTR
jgi:hypothetical protein